MEKPEKRETKIEACLDGKGIKVIAQGSPVGLYELALGVVKDPVLRGTFAAAIAMRDISDKFGIKIDDGVGMGRFRTASQIKKEEQRPN